jgi:hypothetical protein
LLRFDRTIDVARLISGAEEIGVPLALVELSPGEANGTFAVKLVLVRPDQHIAWRGQVAPKNPVALIARITGTAGANVKEADVALPA